MAARFQEVPGRVRRLRHYLPGVDSLLAEFEEPARLPPDVEEVIDQPGQHVDLALGQLAGLDAHPGVVAGQAEQLQSVEQRRQGAAP